MFAQYHDMVNVSWEYFRFDIKILPPLFVNVYVSSEAIWTKLCFDTITLTE